MVSSAVPGAAARTTISRKTAAAASPSRCISDDLGNIIELAEPGTRRASRRD
ncbi:hypothetical protein [Actinocorallia herbida]|uniref:hypothetical protein n=1 Tax=Actinocorallia herbida TaxID=58109 RepID=UPI001476D753|nr:hypothetical protein [Actinocorallia herbida]